MLNQSRIKSSIHVYTCIYNIAAALESYSSAAVTKLQGVYYQRHASVRSTLQSNSQMNGDITSDVLKWSESPCCKIIKEPALIFLSAIINDGNNLHEIHSEIVSLIFGL